LESRTPARVRENAARIVEGDRRQHHGTDARPAAGLIDTEDERLGACARKHLVLQKSTFKDSFLAQVRLKLHSYRAGQGKQMSSITDSSLSVQESTDPSPSGSKKHFDTFETQFFQQGDDSDGLAAEADRFDDLDDGPRRKRFAPSRQFIMSVAVGSACLAIIGCVALWRSGSRGSSPAPVSTQVAAVSTAQTEQPTPVAAPAPPAPTPAPTPALAPPVPAVAQAAARAAPVQAIGSAPPAPVPPASQPVAAREPAVAAPQPVQEAAKPTLAAAGEVKALVPVAAAVADLSAERCKQAIRAKHNKEILSVCADAFAADPSAADVAVELAKIEFDRGRTVPALAWARKAVAADPNAAEAYVFIGGAEQSAGHSKAAKEAYRRYLQLAPSGHYAADLRAIVGSL
jgi:hypothetical protein